MLVIQPFGHIEEKTIRHLKKGLAVFFEEIIVAEEIYVPEEAYNAYRDQYLVDTFMEILKGVKGEKVLGVVDRDIYSPELNFIFGQGRINGKRCIIALERLREDSTRKKFNDRVLKEAVHELGHTWGLHHCENMKCVMHFSNTLDDTDSKTSGFCKKCEARLDRT